MFASTNQRDNDEEEGENGDVMGLKSGSSVRRSLVD